MSEQQDIEAVDAIVARARAAQARYAATANQDQLRLTVQAVAWALMEPARNQALSEHAVASTGLGNVADKVRKNHRKTLGLMRDVLAAATTGVVREDPASGITEIARPVGVVGAVVPSTNPVATPTNNVINALACGNAIVLSPSPRGAAVCEQLIAYIHAEFAKIGADPDLVQMVPAPSSKVKTQHLMESVDLLIVTGSQDNVRRAYASGTPAIGVGAGNVSVIVDGSGDLDAAAEKIAASKSFDNATSCSSENALIVLDAVYDDMLAALHRAGGRLLQGADAAALHGALFQAQGLNKHLIARDIDVLIAGVGVSVPDADTARFLLIEGDGVGASHPESGEKLSLVTTLYRVPDFDAAKRLATALFTHVGAGHSIGLHSADEPRALELARELPTCRVIVNQAHCFATGGSFDNGMPFSLSMGCGSWGGNSIDDNLHYKHFMNISKVVRVIPPREPSLDAVFEHYWAHAGR
ncbi:MAG: aldehyde dehydrogenase family protein [Pseudomonadota bacterium]